MKIPKQNPYVSIGVTHADLNDPTVNWAVFHRQAIEQLAYHAMKGIIRAIISWVIVPVLILNLILKLIG